MVSYKRTEVHQLNNKGRINSNNNNKIPLCTDKLIALYQIGNRSLLF